MADAQGGAGDERREDWTCKPDDGGCGMVHGYTFRRGNITRLRVELPGFTGEWTGDGGYTCPRCGRWVKWVAGQAALSRLMRNRTGAVG